VLAQTALLEKGLLRKAVFRCGGPGD